MKQTSDAKRFAFLFAGPPTHHFGSVDHASYSSEFEEHALIPATRAFQTSIFVTSEKSELEDWESLLGRFRWDAEVEAVEISTGSPIDHLYHMNGCWNSGRNNKFLQWAHMQNTWSLMKRYEDQHGVVFDFLGKWRIDLHYRPGHVLRPDWLLKAPRNMILASSTEFEEPSSRWFERLGDPEFIQKWGFPKFGINDQLMFGNSEVMRGVLHFAETKKCVRMTSIGLGLTLRDNNGSVLPVDFQFSNPGGRFGLGKGGKWLDTPCNCCFEPPYSADDLPDACRQNPAVLRNTDEIMKEVLAWPT
jgi:hypothetical protein